MLLTGVATVEGIELGDDVLVAAVNLLAGTAAVVVLGGEEDVEATDALEGGEEVVAGTDETCLLTALLAWNGYCPEFSFFHFCVYDCETCSDGDGGAGEGGVSPQDDQADKSAGARPSHRSRRN